MRRNIKVEDYVRGEGNPLVMTRSLKFRREEYERLRIFAQKRHMPASCFIRTAIADAISSIEAEEKAEKAEAKPKKGE